jgi:hypothetical protein
MKYRIIILLEIFLIISCLRVSAAGTENNITWNKLKNSSDESLYEYSGKEVKWSGVLKQLVSSDAYFDYLLQLPSGDNINICSDRGLPFKEGDEIEISGFIMLSDGSFSHIVLNDVKKVERTPVVETAFIKPEKLPSSGSSEKDMSNTIFNWIRYYNRGVPVDSARYIAYNIISYSSRYNVDPLLVTAIISAESAFNTGAISVAGAIGLGQLMPDTARMMGVNPYNPEQNIAGCARYIRGMLDRWHKSQNQLSLALASYNAGPGAVEKFGGIPPYRETINYVEVVLGLYNQLRMANS